MKIGDIVWVRDMSRTQDKISATLEFEKGDQVVLSFDESRYLCVYDKGQIVDAPTESELQALKTNEVLAKVFSEAKGNWDFCGALDKLGYKIVRQSNETN